MWGQAGYRIWRVGLREQIHRSGDDVLMFMANTALEKIGWPCNKGHQPAASGDNPSGHCIFDRSVGEVVSEFLSPAVNFPSSDWSLPQGHHRRSIHADALRAKLFRELGKIGGPHE